MHKAIRIVALLLVIAAVVLAALALMLGRQAKTQDIGHQAPLVQPASTHAYRTMAAAADLPPGQPIRREQLVELSIAQPSADGFATPDEATGAIPLRAIPAGTALSRTQFAQGVSALLMPGERALAVPVDELTGAGNRIAPGDHVDVFLSLRPAANDGVRAPPQSRLLLSRLRVLGYGAMDLSEGTGRPADAQAEPPQDRRAQAIAGQGEASSGGSDRGAQANARSALLAVPVEQANALLLGAQSGKLFLALRHPGDAGVADANLFAQPATVLRPQAGLDDAQRLAALSAPENAAFSGIDLEALAGSSQRTAAPAIASPRRSSTPRERGVEIIRGDGRTHHAQAR